MTAPISGDDLGTAPVPDEDIMAMGEAVRQSALDAFVLVTGDVSDQLYAYFEEKVAHIPDRFTAFLRTRIPLSLVLKSLDNTVDRLSDPDVQNVDTVKNFVSDWQGNAADAFDEIFCTRFAGVHHNHIELAREIKRILLAQLRIVALSRRAVMNIGEGTCQALDALRPTTTNVDGIPIALTVVAAVSSVVGMFAGPAAPAAMAVGWALAAGGATVASSAISSTTTVAGGSPEEVLATMDSTFADLRTAVDDEQRILRDVIADDYGRAMENWDRLFLYRPRIAEGGSGSLPEFVPPPGLGGG